MEYGYQYLKRVHRTDSTRIPKELLRYTYRVLKG